MGTLALFGQGEVVPSGPFLLQLLGGHGVQKQTDYRALL